MGAGVSNWNLARTVASMGELGVVSGTALDSILARRLQVGDPGGHMRRALEHFPWPDVAQRIIDRYFIPGGKPDREPFKLISLPIQKFKQSYVELSVASNFAEVFLAREGHGGFVGINYLEKIQLPNMPAILGAMLANVAVVLMGAGMPLAIPGVLDGLAQWQPVELKMNVVENDDRQTYVQRFDPAEYFPNPPSQLNRPQFLAIISSEIMGKTMVRKANGSVEGFVVEGYTAGGHNAPPRSHNNGNKPEFGERDIPDLEKVKELGLPFWLAGSYASPEKLKEALAMGAAGIQVGTIFAYSTDSGIKREIRDAAIKKYKESSMNVVTDFRASPTGYPFKRLDLDNITHSAQQAEDRMRICDLGYLRTVYSRGDNKIGYRCPSEPVDKFLVKGGKEEDAADRMCLCNGLMATIGLGQTREEGDELPIVTSGEDFSFMPEMVARAGYDYGAKDVVEYLRG